MDFFKIEEVAISSRVVEITPEFETRKSKDVMIRGKTFYAIWDPDRQLWTKDESRVQELVDREIDNYIQDKYPTGLPPFFKVRYMINGGDRGAWVKWRKYVANMFDNWHQLDADILFADQPSMKEDYHRIRLSYSMASGDCPAYDELMTTLYSPKDRQKLEWAIGSIFAGDSKKIQKFIVLYGEPGTGKSTILDIIEQLFEGYCSPFDAKSLGSANDLFGTEAFKDNPLVAIQHDGDLSKISDNTKLNQIVSHEKFLANEKGKPHFPIRANAMLFMGTNTPVKISDSKSGMLRRLIDVYPTGKKLPFHKYLKLMSDIHDELPMIAAHCYSVYQALGKGAYNNYIPIEMMYETNDVYNFMETNYFYFKEAEGTTAAAAFAMYKSYCEEVGMKRKDYTAFRAELKSYFKKFDEVVRIDGKQVRSWYSDFAEEKFNVKEMNDISVPELKQKPEIPKLVLDKTVSLFDQVFSDIPAQLAGKTEKPTMAWDKVTQTLKDIDTKKVHYCKPPTNHIVIDFDFKDKDGNKDIQRNLIEAAKWPPTYAEVSKSGGGIHLHYNYEGDTRLLASSYSDYIEIKTFNGGSSLRRKLIRCNDIPIASISSGLPLKGAKMVNFSNIQNEKAIRTMIAKSLRKEYEPHHTKPAVEFIFSILKEAHDDGLEYDVRDMKQAVIAFANNSSNNAEYCNALVEQMIFCSDDADRLSEPTKLEDTKVALDQLVPDDLIFYDVEVFPNLFLVNYKLIGPGHSVVRLINPNPEDLEWLMHQKLVGFNCRRYDNHILYARYIGYSLEQLFLLSSKIVGSKKGENQNIFFAEAYGLSYTDVYDFCAKKQSLKKWEIELGFHHQELGLPWDKPVPEELWIKVAEYCDNDVLATEKVFEAQQGDFKARCILADLSTVLTGYGSVNDTTNTLTKRIILRGDKEANKQFVYPDLSKIFPGYEYNPYGFPVSKYTETFDKKKVVHKSYFQGCDPSEGGRVFATPGMYFHVKTFDVASMHPSSIIAENGFGKYTQNLKDLLDLRLAVKHGDFEKAKGYFNGAVTKYLDDPKVAKSLAYALKIAINSVYGLTSAKFHNEFKDPRNIDNWVAKRGALMMIALQHAVEEKGFTVVHIKTDSIKVFDPTPELEEFIVEFGKKYGYSFEVESIFDRICLVNKSTYIAKHAMNDPDKDMRGHWDATGDQFKQPYIFKKLFSKEPIEFEDLCETKTTDTALYLDMNENLPSDAEYVKALKKLDDKESPEAKELMEKIAQCHNYIFIGKAGQFCPIKPGNNAGQLMRIEKDGRYSAAEGTTGYLWMESELVKNLGMEDQIDYGYFEAQVDQAIKDVSEFGDFEMFVSVDEIANV